MRERRAATTMKVHSAIAKALIDNGIETMFGLIGDANLYVVDSFVREFGGTFVAAANEAGATLMALGYATVSGKVGVATVTHGPAVTNTLTGLVEGVKGQTPMVLICGDTAVDNREASQNIPQREVIIATGAGFEQLRSPSTLTQDVATVLRRAMLERRPVALNVPIEFQWLDVEYRSVILRIPETRGFVPAGIDLDNGVGIIAGAKRPIVLAGRGAVNTEARAALVRLAERTGALLATTLKAKELFLGEDYNLGVFGTLSTPVAMEAIMESDCIIAFGASLNSRTTSHGTFLKGKRLVQCNAEPIEIGKSIMPDAGLVGDPALVADAIVHWLDEAEIAPSGFRNEALNRRLKAYSPVADLSDTAVGGILDVHKVLAFFNEVVPTNRVLVTDGGRFCGAPWRMMNVSEPGSFLYTLNSGSIGLGLSYAIGASYAVKDRPVLLVTGDGGFMLGGLAEFNTAVRHNVDLIVVVCNDSSYGAEHVQFRNKNMDPALSIFDWPDFAPVADALGGKGVTVRTVQDLESAARSIEERDGPLLIDIKLDPDRMPPPAS